MKRQFQLSLRRAVWGLLALSLAPVFGDEPPSDSDFVHPGISFTRSFLMPLGMPVVVAYHHTKESLFFNYHAEEASGLEAVGDFFLAPTRYFYAGYSGRKLSFTYGDYGEVWKTPLSFIGALLCERLGVFCKMVALVEGEGRRRYEALYRQEERAATAPYRPQGVTLFHTQEPPPCQHIPRPGSLSKEQQVEIRVLKRLAEILDEEGILYWLDCGSCLGVYRHGGMIPWDYDIDLSILRRDHDAVVRALEKLDSEEFQLQDWSSGLYPKSFLKLYVKETGNLIDLYEYEAFEGRGEVGYFYTHKDSFMPDSWKKVELAMMKRLKYDEVFPLRRASFDGVQVWVPNQIEVFLRSKYGENLSPSMVWDEEAGKYRKVKDHPYWQFIK